MLKELKECFQQAYGDNKQGSEEAEAYAAKGFHNLKGEAGLACQREGCNPAQEKRPLSSTRRYSEMAYISKQMTILSNCKVHGGKVVFADWFKGYASLL